MPCRATPCYAMPCCADHAVHCLVSAVSAASCSILSCRELLWCVIPCPAASLCSDELHCTSNRSTERRGVCGSSGRVLTAENGQTSGPLPAASPDLAARVVSRPGGGIRPGAGGKRHIGFCTTEIPCVAFWRWIYIYQSGRLEIPRIIALVREFVGKCIFIAVLLRCPKLPSGKRLIDFPKRRKLRNHK